MKFERILCVLLTICMIIAGYVFHREDQKMADKIRMLEGESGLYGKKMIVLGDSLTIGAESQGTLGRTWIELLGEKYHMTVYNYGISGTKVSSGGDAERTDDMCRRIDDILAEHDTCDIFILMGGANDKNQNVPLGSISDTSDQTFRGAVREILHKVSEKYQKNCRVLAMTTYHRYDTPNSIGIYEIEYVNAMLDACASLGVPCFNNYAFSGLSLAEYDEGIPAYPWADSGLADGKDASHHFSAEAYEYLMPVYEHFIGDAVN